VENHFVTAGVYTVAVRTLCEFAAKRGDLDLRFTPSPSAQEGIEGHLAVAASRTDHYASEVSLSGTYQTLLVRGRADGYNKALKRIEEVKTHRGRVEKIPANHTALHWAQAKVYAWLLCERDELTSIEVALVYFNVDSREQTLLLEQHSAQDLREFFTSICNAFIEWAQQEAAHRSARNQACATLPFPFEQLHAEQRVFAQSVYRAATGQRCLVAQAPTGVGKTLGSLFPLLKAFEKQALDKVFYLTAKTSGRAMALDALYLLSAKHLRTLELVARDKACEHPDKECHGDSCPLAKGFYDRLPAARASASASTLPWSKETLRTLAMEHQVCPYYLSHELVRWADIIVGDYNYYFDLSAMLYAQTVNNNWRVSVLVDEAHNLVDRSRAMYSAQLEVASFLPHKQTLPKRLKKDFDRALRVLRRILKEQTQAYEAANEIPDALSNAIDTLIATLGKELADEHDQLGSTRPGLQQLFFELLHFQKISLLFDTHFFFEFDQANACVRIRNVLPAPMLKPRFESADSVALFSATLNPASAYVKNLGLPDNTVVVDVDSPFSSEQLQVNVMRNISTRYKDRQASLQLLTQTMAQQFHARPGNYLAFLSSFDYLSQVYARFHTEHPNIPCWRQERAMSETERSAFLDRFKAGGQGIGFVVLGGVFSEGVDLPGERLIGAFIATLGLPQVNELNEQMKQRMHNLLGDGYEHVYLYPGIQKVVQAAGRVIRSKEDQGVVYLMDDRFTQAQVRELLPPWWQLKLV
jgi:DNA excision repair protein ERCC-2